MLEMNVSRAVMTVGLVEMLCLSLSLGTRWYQKGLERRGTKAGNTEVYRAGWKWWGCIVWSAQVFSSWPSRRASLLGAFYWKLVASRLTELLEERFQKK